MQKEITKLKLLLIKDCEHGLGFIDDHVFINAVIHTNFIQQNV